MESTSRNIFLIPFIAKVKNIKSLDLSAFMEQIIIKPIHVLQSDPNSVSSSSAVEILPFELPKFFGKKASRKISHFLIESKENRSQQILSRLEQIEKRVDDEIESAKQIQNEDEKVKLLKKFSSIFQIFHFF